MKAKDERALVEVIVKYFEEDKEKEFVCKVKEEIWRFSWDRIVKKIESFKVFRDFV